MGSPPVLMYTHLPGTDASHEGRVSVARGAGWGSQI